MVCLVYAKAQAKAFCCIDLFKPHRSLLNFALFFTSFVSEKLQCKEVTVSCPQSRLGRGGCQLWSLHGAYCASGLSWLGPAVGVRAAGACFTPTQLRRGLLRGLVQDETGPSVPFLPFAHTVYLDHRQGGAGCVVTLVFPHTLLVLVHENRVIWATRSSALCHHGSLE